MVWLTLLDDIRQYLQVSHKDRGLSARTTRSREKLLRAFARSLRKPWAKVTTKDVLGWLASRHLAPSSEQTYRQSFNGFFEWLKVPVKLPFLKVPKRLLSPQELVRPEEVLQIVQVLDHPRDRALVMLLYETGARAHELLGVRLQDVEFLATHARVRLSGKTGDRIVPVLESVPDLQAWLNYCHPPLQPDEVVWRSRQGVVCYTWLLQILKRASLQALGRAIPCHRLRHSRATFLAAQPGFTDSVIAKFGGWRVGSPILATYVHLSGRDVEPAFLAMHGKATHEEAKPSPLLPKVCPRCQHENPAASRFCSQCSLILDVAEAARILQRDTEVFGFIEWLIRNPKEVERLRAKMQAEKT